MSRETHNLRQANTTQDDELDEILGKYDIWLLIIIATWCFGMLALFIWVVTGMGCDV